MILGFRELGLSLNSAADKPDSLRTERSPALWASASLSVEMKNLIQ